MRRTVTIVLVAGAALSLLAAEVDAQMARATGIAGTSKVAPGHFGTYCDSGEVLVGIHGRAGTIIDRIGGYCVRVNAAGEWVGEIRATESHGGRGGTPFNRQCRRGDAMSGFRGRAGLYVDRIQIRCQKLTSPTAVTGTAYWPAAVGGSGGTAFTHLCPVSGKPVFGFGGQSAFGGYVDQLFYLCRV